MGNGDEVQFSPEEMRAKARELVKDAGEFAQRMEDTRQGLLTASTDAAPWFSAGGWGMFNQPAAAASEGERFLDQIDRDINAMGEDFEKVLRNLAAVDVTSSTELDRVWKVTHPDE